MVSMAFSTVHYHKTKDIFQFSGSAKTLLSSSLIPLIKGLSLQSRTKQKQLSFEVQGSASHMGSEGTLSEFPIHLPLAHLDFPLMVKPIFVDPPE